MRCNVTLAHSKTDMGYTLEALAAVGPMLDLIPKGSKTSTPTMQKAIWAAESKLRGFRNAGMGYLLNEIGQAGTKVTEWTRGRLGGEDAKSDADTPR